MRTIHWNAGDRACHRVQPTPRETNSVTDEAAPTNIIAPAPRANEAANAASPMTARPLHEPKGADRSEERRSCRPSRSTLWRADRAGPVRRGGELLGRSGHRRGFRQTAPTRRLKHLEIGKLGETEGAAGSIYLTIPVSFYGASNRSAANVILRRVNEVPGSTKAQRRWHIERIEWKA